MTAQTWESSDVATSGIFASRWWLVLVGVAVGGTLGVADLLGSGSWGRALTDVAIVAGYTTVLAIFRTRSETASVLAGIPVDERWQAINLHALAAAGMIAASYVLGSKRVRARAEPYESGIVATGTARLRLPNGQYSDLRRTVAAQVKFMPDGFDAPIHVLRWYDAAWSE